MGMQYRHGEYVGFVEYGEDDGEYVGGVEVTYAEGEYGCDWHVMVLTEDGRSEMPCGAPSRDTPRGWECDAGHEYVMMEIRHAERWEYAEDEVEARRLRSHGIEAVAMNGGLI